MLSREMQVTIDTQIAANDAEIERLQARIAQLVKQNAKLHQTFKDEGGWPRYYPAVTNSGPHIHSSVNCSTLHHGRYRTEMRWATQMSGMTEAEAVEALDEALCSVCFASAPVALRVYVSRRSQAEQAQRLAEKAERDAVRDAKRLAADEVFRMIGWRTERVETVAACKDLIRAVCSTQAELDWYTSGRALARHTANGTAQDAEFYERLARNLTDRLAADQENAANAERVLLAREARQAGHGADAAAIAKIKAAATRKAAKDWA